MLTQLTNAIWQPLPHNPIRRLAVQIARFGYVVARDMSEGQLSMRAMGLVYITLLSFVPLLALSFSVLKAFGVHNQIEPFLAGILAPLGEKGTEITAQVILFVENVKVGVLGALGLAILIYTVIALIQKIEGAFNHIWRIGRTRPLAQRFSGYLSVIIVSPVLIFSAIAIGTNLLEAANAQQLTGGATLGVVFSLLGKLVPFVLTTAVFTMIYLLIPNTRVYPLPALIGGAAAAVLWQLLGTAFATFTAGATGSYDAIYSSFAVVIVFMIWLYASWLVVLVGASVAFYTQNPDHITPGRQPDRPDFLTVESTAFAIMEVLARRFSDGETGATLNNLTAHVSTRPQHVEHVLEQLTDMGYVLRTDETPARYLPARPPQLLELFELWEGLRGNATGLNVHPTSEQITKGVKSALKSRTVKHLMSS